MVHRVRTISKYVVMLVKLVKRTPVEIRYITVLFFSSRLILTLIGVFSRFYLQQRIDFSKVPHRAPTYPDTHTWLNIWGVWDTGWYLNIAQNWYNNILNSHGGANYGFFPLYPFLMRILGFIVGNNFISGLLISNLAFLFGAYVLHKLVSHQSGSETADRAVLFMFLFPTAFIFSAVFSESLFVLCMISAFYFANRNRWFLAGLFGGLVALTRSVGVFISLPLLLLYLQNRSFNLHKIRADILCLAFVPLGLGVFCLQCYLVTGDFLAFAHIQQTGWGHELTNPLMVLWRSLGDGNILHLCNGIFSISMISIICIGIRQIPLAYWLMAMILMIFPPLAGHTCMNSMLRYSLVVFPIYILCAKIPVHSWYYQLIVISLSMLQGALMVFWTNSFDLII